MAFSSRFSPRGSSKSTPAQSATSNSFNALADLPLDFNDFSDNGLTQEELDSEHIDFDSMDIDAAVVKAELATRRSTRGKATRSAPEAKGSESVARLLKTVLQQTAGLNNFMSQTTKTNSGIRITPSTNRISCNIVKAKYVRAWSKVDWSQFRSHIVSKELDFSNINSRGESEDAIKYLYNCIKESIEKAVPLIKMKPKFVSWWSQNLEWLLTKVKRARKRMVKDRTLESVQIFENSRSNWESAVRKAKQRYWKQKFEQATNSSIWKINKKHTMAHTDAVPDLDGAGNFIDKCSKLRSTLFPVTDQILPNIPDNFVISKCNLSESFSSVSRSEVKRVLKAIKP
jgi:hypothetical protein